MPEQMGTPPFITFRSEVANAIGDARRALMRGDSVRELEALRSTLYPWAKDDQEYLEGVKGLENEILHLRQNNRWPRPRIPWWESRYYSLLIDLAKRHDLLDIESIIHLDEEEL